MTPKRKSAISTAKSHRRDSVPGADPASPAPVTAAERRVIAMILGAYGIVLAIVLFAVHRTPLYGVETDLMGEYIPAAQELLSGTITAAHYSTKGFGYPLLLAAVTGLCGGDAWLGARLLSLIAAVAGLGAVWALARAAAGPMAAAATLLTVMMNPVHFSTAVEAGTDQPAFALMVGSTALLLLGGRRRTFALAGLAAGWAVITRYNAAFLPVAAAFRFATHPPARRGMAVYALAAAVPIGAWMATNTVLTGSPFTNTNHYNVAYALYGRNVQWNAEVMASLRSLGDVIAFDPARALATFGRQVATNWFRDLTQLVPPWIGVFSLLGLAMSLPGVRHRGTLALHLGLSYLTVAAVFYDARFALYALPFYVLVAMALLIEVRVPLLQGIASAPRLRIAAASLAILASGVLAVKLEGSALAHAPHQVQDAARRMRASGVTGPVIARKPHVAYFAGTSYVPLPGQGRLQDVLALGRAEGAKFLYFSAMESQARPDLAFLGEPDVQLPGLEPLEFARLDSVRFYALYRLTGEVPAASTIDSALVGVLAGRVLRHPEDIAARNALAGHLLGMNLVEQALVQLEATVQLAPDDPLGWGLLSVAAWRHGDLTRAAEAGERALALGPDSWWIELQMARIRTEQGRFDAAFRHFDRALAIHPAGLETHIALGEARLIAGEPEKARDAFLHALMLAPGDSGLRAECARRLTDAGRPDLAKEIESAR